VPYERVESWKKEINSVIDSGIFIGGKHVLEFEQMWANAIGTKYAIGVSNGFDGLTLALESLNLAPGSLVAVPAHTFIATWTSVARAGLTPIGVDVDDEGLMNLDELLRIAKKVKVVIPVHMHGSMVNMELLQEICEANNILIIEDASQAHFASFNGKLAGSYGHVNVFSLYPTKNLGALGDAGVITTNNQSIYKRILEMRSYGSSNGTKYEHQSLGYNQRLDTIQAAILKVNLKYLSSDNLIRQKIALHFENNLQWDSFKPLQRLQDGRVFHHYCIVSKHRNELRKYLLDRGIETEIHYPNLAAKEFDKMFKRKIKSFPNGDRISKSILSLPNSPWHSMNQIEYVISALNEFQTN
jgi:dTDP-4-amino-4,6-dideoxygalactose transaminase